MPIHDWSRVNPGLFHHFNHAWTAELSKTLNAGVLPAHYFALSEQTAGGLVPDVLTLERTDDASEPELGGLAVATAPPRATFVRQAEAEIYVSLANQIAIRHSLGRVVAMIEIVSPGNKQSTSAIRKFVQKAIEFLSQGIHLLIVDLFPPSRRDPHGIHKVIWDEIQEEPFELPSGKPLTLASYVVDQPMTAYIEPLGIGDEMPDWPIFLSAERYVKVPLERSYRACWESCPVEFKKAIEAS